MFNRYERALGGLLLLAGICMAAIGYISFGEAAEPHKVWFATAGGDVILDHDYHASLADCADCHHDIDGAEAADRDCRACHYTGRGGDEPTADPHPRAIGANCIDCHNEVDETLTTCGTCHVPAGAAYTITGRAPRVFPAEIVFDTEVGRVGFDHALHAGEDVGAACADCHHGPRGGEGMTELEGSRDCRACHYDLADNFAEEGEGDHIHFIGNICADCHDADECETCHTDE